MGVLGRVPIVAVLAFALIAPVGCSSKTPVAPDKPNNSSSLTTTPADSGTPARAREDQAVGYFASGEKVVPVRLDADAGDRKAALEQLFAGPTSEALAAGYASAIPKGTRLLGLEIEGGTATLDVSEQYGTGGGSLSMMLRVAQVVFTLTREPDVKRVVFMMNGAPIAALGGEGLILEKPQTRADWEDFSPTILIESPVLGDTIESPVTITGTANVFEARFQISIRNSENASVIDQAVQAASGTGTRGAFMTEPAFEQPSGTKATIVAWYASPKDGAPVEVVRVPVTVK